MASLISATDLAARLGDPSLAVLEVSFAASDESYRSGHVPGAVWAYWKDLLWDERMRVFASPEELGERLGALGLGAGTTIVLCGDPVQFAAYAFWALTAAGHGDLLFLDGGKEHWLGAGLPLSTELVRRPPVARRPATGPESRAGSIGRDGVLAALQDGGAAILDFRSLEEYRGERVSPETMGVDHGAERKGRIPTARHLYYRDLLNEDWTLRSPAELDATLRERGVSPRDPVIAYCRLSHRASLGWFALTELLGLENVRVYDGSWTEWGSMVGMPIER